MEKEKQNIGKTMCLVFLALFLGTIIGFFLYERGVEIGTGLFIIAIFSVILITIRSVTIATFLFFLTIPLGTIGIVMDMGFTLRPVYVFATIFIIAILYDCSKSEHREQWFKKLYTPIDIPLLLLFTCMVISVLQTIHLPVNPPIISNRVWNYPWIKSAGRILLLSGYICIFYAFQYILTTKEEIKKWFFKYILIGGLIAIYGIIALALFIPTGYIVEFNGNRALVDVPDDLPRIKGTEQEPSFFGFYLMTMIPVILVLTITQRVEKTEFYNNKLLVMVTVSTIVALILSGARSAILGFLFSLITIFLIQRKKESYLQYYKHVVYGILRKIKEFCSTKKGKYIAFLIVFIIILWTSFYWNEVESLIEQGIIAPIIGTFSDTYGKFWSTKLRFLTYGYALDAFRQHPFLGIGYENYNFYTGTRVYFGLIHHLKITWPEVNNYPLKILTEHGIIGFFLFLFFIIVFFYYLITTLKRVKDKFLKALLEGYIAAFVGIAIILLFTSSIARPYLWLTFGFAIAAIKVGQTEENQENKKVKNEDRNKHLTLI